MAITKRSDNHGLRLASAAVRSELLRLAVIVATARKLPGGHDAVLVQVQRILTASADRLRLALKHPE